MTPHEFLKYTAQSNCGECGHPACLAFAVAVTKGGADPSGCPYLERSALPPEFTGGNGDETGLEKVKHGQDERDMALVAHLKSKVQTVDFQILAPVLGAEWEETPTQALVFSYLNRQVRLGKNMVRMDSAELVDPRDQILLYNYIAFGGGRPPSGEWIGMESLPNSISKVTTLKTYCENRLAKRFSGREEALHTLCRQVGAATDIEGQSASVAAVIPVLPHVPQLLLFWDEAPEEGFQATVKVLFDIHVLDFLDLESLVFAAERMADRLAELDEVSNG
jgi:hypothetical protein